MKYIQAKDIRDGDIIKARHGHAKVLMQFRDIEMTDAGYVLGDVTLKIRYDDRREYTFTIPANREIMRVRMA